MAFSKNKNNLSKTTVLLAILSVLTLASCKKDVDSNSPVKPAGLAIVHASPGTTEYHLNINGKPALRNPVSFGTFITYSSINTGTHEFSISRKGETALLSRTPFNIKKDVAYSVYIADIATRPVLVLTEDNLSAPVADRAKIRFVNMSPDAGSLDLGIAGNNKRLYTNTAFKNATAFSMMDPAAEVNFEIKETGKADVLASLPKVKIEKNKIYTIWAKGLRAANDNNKLSIGIITNK